MKKPLFSLTAILTLVLVLLLATDFCQAAAENTLVGTVQPGRYRENEFPTNFRVTALGAGVVPGGGGRGFSGAMLVDYGRRWLGFETGVQFLAMPVSVRVSNPYAGTPQGTTLMPMTMNTQYVGVPFYVKYNYIEHPQAAFSLKLGAMPAFLVGSPTADSGVDSSGGQVSLNIPSTDFLVLGGFTGSAPLSETLAFVLDGTYYQGTAILDQYGNTRNQGIIIGAGIRYSL